MNSKQFLALSSVSLVGASAAWATADYGPAVDRMITGCSKWYTTGYGHKFAVVHDMEGYYLTGTSYLRRCDISVSCHYTVNGLVDYSGDAPRGEISQLVREAYYAWHAGCWNRHSLGVEHEGFVSNPAWYTEEMYQASALLFRHFADKFGFAKDRNHIVGHYQWQDGNWVSYCINNFGFDPRCNSHTDPGPYWNWSHYMDLINGAPALVDNAAFVSQTVANGTSFSPGQAFTCTWTMRNNGTTTWIANGGDGYTLNYVSGTQMGAPNATPISGNVGPGGNASIPVSFTAPATPGSYSVVMQMNSASFVFFGQQVSVAINVANPAPVITTQPASTTKDPGQTATFTVAATGATGYQWKKNGVNISGATSSTLTLSNVQLSDAAFYTVVLSNAGGSVTSSQAQLVVTSSAIAVGTGGGLRGLYYNNTDFSSLRVSRLDGPVNFDWVAGSPDGSVGADTFAARWTGQVEPRYSQTYTFYTGTDDGVRLWVNGVLLVDRWTDQGHTEWSGSIALTAGQKYDIRMDYYENGGSASAQLRWSSASQVKQLIPAAQLYRPPPVLATIANKTVAESTLLSVPVSLTSWDQVGAVTSFEDFESYSDGTPTDQIMFRKPGNSSTTSTYLDGSVTNYDVPTASFPAGRGGTRVMHASWSFLTGTTDPWLRFNTFNAATRPNPTIDLNQSLWFDVYSDKALKVAVDVRETSTTSAIGDNGGTTGTIEFVGASSKTGNTPSPTRTVSAGSWTTLKFNLPQEPAVGFTGNGILESATGKAVMEALALIPAGSMGVYHVYLDNFLQVQNTALTYALEPGAPTGATIDPNTGVFAWTPTPGQGPATYNITVRATSAGSPSMSATKSFAVTVSAPPIITAQPQDQNVFPGGNATFSVTATGTAPLAYQWHKDASLISGATASSLTLASAQSSDSGSYSVVVANSLGSVTSSPALLMVSEVDSPPSIVAQPGSLTRNQGASAAFGATVAGSLPLVYQWYLNGTPLPGATENNYTDSNVQPADAGTYTLVVTNDFGTATSDPAILTVIMPPTITTHPVSQAVTQGASVTFTASADGTPPLAFQWRKNGSAIGGATGTSYSLSNVQAATAGTYTVVVSNDAGSATSGNAVLTVYVPPAITAQPVGQSLAAGSSVTFNVTATGNPAPAYQWRRNGLNISGATASSYTRSNIQTGDVGLYSVIVSNFLGSVLSADAALSLNNGVIVFSDNFDGGLGNWTRTPTTGTDLDASSAQNHTSGGSQSAYVNSSLDKMFHNLPWELEGRARLSFWVYDSTPNTSNGGQTRWFGELRGYTGYGYQSSGVQQLFALGRYGINFGTGTGTLAGEVMNPTNYHGRVLSGANAGWFNTTVQRSGVWHKFEIERAANGTTINFYVDGTLARSVTAATYYTFDCAVIGSVGSGTGAAGEVWFDDLKVEYFDPPTITSQPVGTTVVAGGSATFTVAAVNNALTYQWRLNGENIPGATSASLTVNNAQAANAGSYTVVVANGAGPTVSTPAVLLVAPVITSQPASQTNLLGSTVSFTVAAAGQTPIAYRWQKNGADLTDGGITSGAQTATLTLTGIAQADEGVYTVGVTNAAGGVLSAQASLVVIDPPLITTQPVSKAAAVGANVTFSVVASGTAPLSYQWMADGQPIPGATDASYTRSNVQAADSGANFTVTVTNLAGAATSDPATLLVNTAPTLTALPDRTVHALCPVVITAYASDPEAPPQSLNFTLDAAPPGATIEAGSGVFNWMPSASDVGTTNTITVRVADTGEPAQSASRTFLLIVVDPLVIASAVVTNDTITLTWNAVPDQTYRVQFKDNLTDADWNDLTDVTATADTASAIAGLTGDLGPIPQRFYRIMVAY